MNANMLILLRDGMIYALPVVQQTTFIIRFRDDQEKSDTVQSNRTADAGIIIIRTWYFLERDTK
jgi:hypothetical protein